MDKETIPALTTSIHGCTRDLSEFSKGTKNIKGANVRKEDVTVSVCR